MRAKATATTIAVLLLTACSQSVQVEDKRLTGIVNLKCYAPVVLGHTKGLIIDTESWKLLHYEIESDTLKELTVSPGFKKGVEKRWTIEKQGTTLAVTSREAFSEQYFEERIKKSAAAHANMKKHGLRAMMFTEEDLLAFDKFTEARREDYSIIRTKINLTTMDAEIFEKRNWGFSSEDKQTDSGSGFCEFDSLPTGLVSSD